MVIATLREVLAAKRAVHWRRDIPK
jgi:hypothetical protein